MLPRTARTHARHAALDTLSEALDSTRLCQPVLPLGFRERCALGPQSLSPTIASYSEQLFHARRPLIPKGTQDDMPRPAAPPTPGSSSDIRGKEGQHAAPAFALPPSSYQDLDPNSTSSSPQSNNGSDSSYQPVSPGAPGNSKRPLATGGVVTPADFALPPPPTRSRKIIQMKPREGGDQQEQSVTTTVKTAPQQTNGRRKQNSSATTAAGRKIARKTAHSLIERRRRSKMNEEFGVLKDMIPACKGQEMHKLAILQVSVNALQRLSEILTLSRPALSI